MASYFPSLGIRSMEINFWSIFFKKGCDFRSEKKRERTRDWRVCSCSWVDRRKWRCREGRWTAGWGSVRSPPHHPPRRSPPLPSNSADEPGSAKRTCLIYWAIWKRDRPIMLAAKLLAGVAVRIECEESITCTWQGMEFRISHGFSTESRHHQYCIIKTPQKGLMSPENLFEH